MKTTRYFLITGVAFICGWWVAAAISADCAPCSPGDIATNEVSALRALALDYLELSEPGTTPEVFAPGRISLPGRREGNASFSPDGRLFLFTVVGSDKVANVHQMTRRRDGVWSEPVRASFSNEGGSSEAFVTPDGAQVYFGSNRAPGTPPWNGRLWVTDRVGEAGWSAPRLVDLGIETDKGLWFPTVSRSGALYFGAYGDKGGLENFGKSDLYWTENFPAGSPLVSEIARKGASYGEPKNAGARINSPHEEWDPFIAPDGSYLLFESDRPGGVGGVDIYVSFREADDWGDPINLGPEVNSAGVDVAAKVSPDGRFLFFDRPTKNEQDIYWVSAEVITRLRPRPAKP